MTEVADREDTVAVDVTAALADTGDWSSLEWRLDNLYWIVDENGKAVRFVMNDEQREFIRGIWYRNLILKARQLGFSTLMQVLELDQAIFNSNHNGVVIADTVPNAGKLLAKLEFALRNLPGALREAFPVKSLTSRTSLEFLHGSTVSVSTSGRGGTVQLLHVSELGKIARKYPERAAEIVSGAFESVPAEGIIVVESTAEGAAGEFFDLCDGALKRMAAKQPLSKLDWKLHFYPWYRKKAYRLDPADVVVSDVDRKYFDKLQVELVDTGVEPVGFRIDAWQRAWYVKKRETLKLKMRQEYPSTPKEAFEQAIEGAVYGEEMTYLREQGRLGKVPVDPAYPVNTFWDFGKRDKTAIWFHQEILGQHRWIRYREGSNKGLRHWWTEVCEPFRQEHKFQWGKHYLPHDAKTERLGEEVTTYEEELTGLGMENIVVVPRVQSMSLGIDITRKALVGNHWFDREDCADGIKCMDGYQYEWDDKLGVWSAFPLHNWASHGADAWRTYAQGYETAVEDESLAAFKRRERSWRR